jgi:hypothetical protein
MANEPGLINLQWSVVTKHSNAQKKYYKWSKSGFGAGTTQGGLFSRYF